MPADNCAEAVRNPQPGLPLLQVGSLDEAMTALEHVARAVVEPTALLTGVTVPLTDAQEHPVLWVPGRSRSHRACGANSGHA